MKKNYILCHGFNETEKFKKIHNLARHIDINDNIQFGNYGDYKLLGVRFFNDNTSETIAGMANDNSIGIGHSNGCAILVESCNLTNKIDTLILINPALDKDTVFPESVKRVIVYHNKTDNVVWYSKFLLNHDWGEMGKVGYQGFNDSNENITDITNFDTNELFNAEGHSGVLESHSKELFEHIKGQICDY